MNNDKAAALLKIKFGEAFNQGSRSGLKLFKKALKTFPADQAFSQDQVEQMIDACLASLDAIEGLSAEEFAAQADEITARMTPH